MLDSCGCLEKMTDRREPQALDIGAHEILPDADIALAAGLDELAQMLDLQSGKPSTVAGIRFMAFLEEDEMAFDNLYCIAFQMMDAQWLAKRASYMEFNDVLKSTRAQLERPELMILLFFSVF
ncbi:PREDICTED: uncharacterized protein LOC104706575 [Camelina sativa]|uniref:Uncharacterized protein LOC104706575 n=1 Tax=Camelina sativa TaxID=90675 RepID=A0ABM1QDD0_CAMSA|nr:PREDICTED: uncharacterized protein LOC104706575 [Camelina sativa]